MPEDTAEPSETELLKRVAELEAERQRLQGELDSIANRALDRWLSVEQYESGAVASMQQTLSWKVTKPLRAVREVQLDRPERRRAPGQRLVAELFEALVPERASEDLRGALGRRLATVADLLLGEGDVVAGLAERGSGVLADALVRRVRQNRRDDELWLVLVALTASFPEIDLVLRARRALGVAPSELALSAVLEAANRSSARLDSLDHDLDIESRAAVADVDFCARFDHNTGIQRVVRETMSRWHGVHDVRFACWSEGDNAFRELTALEQRRVVDWNAYRAERPAGARAPRSIPLTPASRRAVGTNARPKIIVPWHTTVILPEVAHAGLWSPLAALARFSGSKVAMIGYDTIPIGSADVILPIESEKFAKYLTVVKSATRIAAISASAADEFRGYVDAVSAQGVSGPHVGCVTLAVESPGRASAPVVGETPGEKLVLIVGNQEPRKNLLAVLFAAETLWREGVAFRLRMIGGGRPDYRRVIDREIRRLKRAGFPVEVLCGASDDVLAQSYRDAYVTLFPSTHEGLWAAGGRVARDGCAVDHVELRQHAADRRRRGMPHCRSA